MGSCPVCYEAFSRSMPETVPRQLPCEDVACTQCLKECFEADNRERRNPEETEGPGVRCPECFRLFAFESVEAVPVVELKQEQQEGEDAGELFDANVQAHQEPTDEGSSSAANDVANGAGAGAPSKLAAFLSTNQNSNNVPANSADVGNGDGVEDACDDDGGEERKCKVVGCSNRAVQSVGTCPVHTKRASVVSVSAMVHKFKDTKLTSVALKSDKVEVNRGGVAGAGEAGFDPDAIGQRFRRQERLELGEAVALIEAVKTIFREENNMVELDAPVMVVGDVHGQYFDLLNILKKWRPDHNLLFLGDYVDRGQFKCKLNHHLFALKLRHPDKVYLIRGNHECSAVSAHFGFKDECKAKYGLTVYYRFLLAFQTMPICALIATSIGRIFACHGGISPEVKHLSDIENIDRFAEPEMQGPLCDMLWADPLNEDDSHKLTDEEYRQFLDTNYIANQVRGCSYMFGYHAVQRFLRENRLMYMVRAHEVQEEGFRSHFPSPAWALAAAAAAAEEDDFTDEDSDLGSEEEEESYDHVLADTSRHLNPTVLTVFSAPNYCDRYRNKAAILHIEKLGYYTVNLLEAEPHPDPVSETDVNVMQLLAMGNTCPYMPTSFREFLKVAVDLGRAVKPTSNIHGVDGSAPPTPTSTASGQSRKVTSRSPVGVKAAGGDAETAASAGDKGKGRDNAQEDEDDDFDKGDSLLPSFAPKERRGVSRMISAPVLGRRSSASSAGSFSESSIDKGKGDSGSGTGVERPPSWDGVDNPNKSLTPEGDRGEGSRLSFLGDFYNSFSRRSIRGFGGLGTRASSPGFGLLSRQNTWTGGSPRGASSEHYRKAHARDGINEMHPEVLNRRISHQESGELEAAAAQVSAAEAAEAQLSSSSTSTASVSPAMTPKNLNQHDAAYAQGQYPTEETTLSKAGKLFGFGGRAFSSAPARSEGGAGGDDIGASPAAPSRGVRRQFALDINLGTPQSERSVEHKSWQELANILEHSSITELAEMDGDVELEPPALGDSTATDTDGPGVGTPGAKSKTTEVWTTPSPRHRRGSSGSGAPSPSQILFTHEEIVVLKLLFSLFDRKGKNFITRDDIIMYAEEGGDFAQLREVDACMEAVDADGDGMVGLSDYINFAARLKDIHSLQQLQDATDALEGSVSEDDYRLPAPTD